MSEESKPDKAIEPQRQKGGKFGKGNQLAKGNSSYRSVQLRATKLKTAFVKGVRPIDMKRITKKVVEEALNGSLPHTELLYRYLIGKGGGGAEPTTGNAPFQININVKDKPHSPPIVEIQDLTVTEGEEGGDSKQA